MRIPITKISFARHAVAHLTDQQFLEKFSSTYPDADLVAYANDLGLVNEPAATVEEAPAIPSPENKKEPKNRRYGNRRADDAPL